MRRLAWALLLSPLLGCAEEEVVSAGPGEVAVFVAHDPLPAPAVVVNDLGYRIEIDRWIAVSASIELRHCDSTTSLLWKLVGGTAAAHVTPTVTRAGGTAQPRDLLGLGTATLFGTLTPPAGAYCQVRYASSPADADVEGSGAVPLLGKSMVIAGRYTAPGASDSVPFALETTLGTRVDLPEVETTGSAPLFRLAPGERLAVTVTLHPREMLEGVDFALQGPAQLESQLVFNLGRGIALDITPVN